MSEQIHHDTGLIKIRTAHERGTGTYLTPDEAHAIGERLLNHFIDYIDIPSTRAARRLNQKATL